MAKLTSLTKTRLALAVAACLASPLVVQAQEKPPEKLETLVVTAGGFEQSLSQAPASISVITREDLETKQFRDLAEAIADVEGVDVRGGTGKTGGLDISIRGMPSDYTLVLIDGRRQNVAGDVTPNGFGSALTSFMPPLSAIERIEVIRGPMSTLYGSDAVGGVVNIITRKVATEWGGNLNIEQTLPEDRAWGTSQKTSIYANGPLIDGVLGLAVRGSTYHREASDWILAAGAAKSGRNPAPAETRQYNAGARLTYTPVTDHEIYLDVDRGTTKYNNEDCRLGNVDGKSTGTGGGASCVGNVDATAAPGYKDYMQLNRNQYVLGHSASLGGGYLDSSLSYATTETEGRTIPGKPIGNGFTGYPNMIIGAARELETTNTIFDTKYVNSYLDGHTTTVGAQYWDAELKDGLIPNKLSQTMLAAFLENEWAITHDLALTLGGRYDKHDEFGSQFSPRAYLVYNALDSLTIKGGVNQGYRAPRLQQLADGISGITGQGADISIGNPNLKPEVSTNTELGFLFNNQQGVAASVTFFHNEVKDKISSGGDCAVNAISSCKANSTATYSINIDEATTWGAELTARFDLPANLNLGLSYTWTDSEIKEDGVKNGKLSDTPEHLANATLRWTPNQQFNLWLKGEFRGEARRYNGDPDNWDATAGNATAQRNMRNQITAYKTVGDIKAWYQFHLGASYKMSEQVNLNAGINNLLDKDFAKFKSYEAETATGTETAYVGEYYQGGQSVKGGVLPGRTFWVSANYNF